MHRFSNLRTKSYLDRASTYDATNRVFFIYYIGTYFNRPLFHYGETDSLELTELRIKRSLPYYQCITYAPVRTHSRKSEFEALIAQNRTILPIEGLESWDVFTHPTDDIDTLKQSAESLYQIQLD